MSHVANTESNVNNSPRAMPRRYEPIATSQMLGLRHRIEGGSILFEPEAENHYFGSIIETTRSTNALGKQPPVNNRFDARVAGDAITTERSMSVMDVDHTNKSYVGGSMLQQSPFDRVPKGLSFSKSNDELNFTSKSKFQKVNRIGDVKVVDYDKNEGKSDKKRDSGEIENIVIRSTEKIQVEGHESALIDHNKLFKE